MNRIYNNRITIDLNDYKDEIDLGFALDIINSKGLDCTGKVRVVKKILGLNKIASMYDIIEAVEELFQYDRCKIKINNAQI